MSGSEYIFQQTGDQAERRRLQLMGNAFDASTRGHLKRLGLGPGAHALEIGPGGGSIMNWMCRETGPEGFVCALDLNTRFIADQKRPNLEMIEGDLRTEELGENRFDFIHARYVLIHIREYDECAGRLIRALKPGGWILLEEPDFSPCKALRGEEALKQSFANIREAIKRMYRTLQLDPRFGRKLRELLRSYSLDHVETEAVTHEVNGGSEVAELMKLSAVHLKDKYLATGAVGEEDIDNYCRFAEDAASRAIYYETVAAWGQKTP